MTTRFIIIRHGETEWNLEGREMGHLDSPLTKRGESQARSVARRAEQSPPDFFYSSDLGRAVQTARIIAERTGNRVFFDQRLRERHMGIFQGLTRAETEKQFPHERAELLRLGAEYVIPGGESAKQRVARTVACLDSLAGNHPGKEIMVVTHSGILKGFLGYVLDLSYASTKKYSLPNAAWNTFLKDETGWKLETWGDLSHLVQSSSVGKREI